MSRNLIDYIRSIVEKKPIELDNGYSQFALNQYFSKFKNCNLLLEVVSKYKLEDRMHYNYLMSVIPYGWQKKIEYNEKGNRQKDIENIIKYYQVNVKVAKEYLYTISENELKYLRELYNV